MLHHSDLTIGKSIVEVLSRELQKEFPGTKGFSAANLWRMCNFYLSYCNSEKLAPLVREISWSNNIVIMEKCKDDLQREFYIQMVKRYGWTKRILTNFIEAQTYEKYLLNQTNFDVTLPAERRVQAKLAVKDEYTFDFAELSPEYSEIGEFEAEYAGKMQLYLTVLDEQVKLPEENPSIGIIICKNKDKTFVEYALKRTNVPIGVATYQLSNSLPDNMRELLPEPEEIIKRLQIFEEDD